MKKSNKEYWKVRAIQLEETLLKKSENYLVDLQEQYKIAERNLEKDISNWYIRFARNNNINLVEAKRFLNSNELKELKWDINQYIKYGEENNINNRWIKELENASAKFHITRLEALKLQLQQEVEVLYGNQLDDIDKTMRDIYTEGYYHTEFEIQKGFNVGFNLMSFSNNELDKVISKPWAIDGKTFSDRIWSNKERLINTLHTELTQSVIRGTSPDKLIKNISDKLNVSKKNAGRLVMTESAYFASASMKDCLNDLGVDKYEIVATLDLHTSEICRELDGKIFDMKDYEVGITAPPFHPWCRTTTCPYFDDEFTIGEKRATRSIDDNMEYIDSNIKYHEWREKYIKDNPQFIVEENKIKNKSRDKKQYEKYKEVLGKDSPKSFDSFQNLKYNNSKSWENLKKLYSDTKSGKVWLNSIFSTEKKFKKHIEKHLNEFGNITEGEYLDIARKLLASPIKGDVEGFTTKLGFVFRYNTATNDFAIGRADGYISTLYRPIDGYKHWLEQTNGYKEE